MKKLLTIILSLSLLSCGKENINSTLVGTKWTAQDDIAELIYGKTCTTTIEFLTKTTCQEIEIRNLRTGSFSGTFVTKGTYTTKGDSVTWVIDKLKMSGKVSGSTLSTNMRRVYGGNRVYNKD